MFAILWLTAPEPEQSKMAVPNGLPGEFYASLNEWATAARIHQSFT